LSWRNRKDRICNTQRTAGWTVHSK